MNMFSKKMFAAAAVCCLSMTAAVAQERAAYLSPVPGAYEQLDRLVIIFPGADQVIPGETVGFEMPWDYWDWNYDYCLLQSLVDSANPEVGVLQFAVEMYDYDIDDYVEVPQPLTWPGAYSFYSYVKYMTKI